MPAIRAGFERLLEESLAVAATVVGGP
jgi:hypothetical protein